MRWQRIKTIVVHSWYHLTHSVETWVDLFYSSVVEIIVFGLIALYMSKSGVGMEASVLVLGFLLWTVLYIAQYSLSVGMMWEVWSKSFSTLFISPLTVGEFLVGQMIGSCLKSMAVFGVTAVAAGFVYKFSVLSLGWWLAIYFLELVIFGWAAGIFVMGLIIRFGTTIQSLSWGLLFLVQPLGAMFFPLAVLPGWLQVVAKSLPVTYVMEAARGQMMGRGKSGEWVVMATGLNVIYFLLASLFMKRMLKYAKETGAFVRMEQ